MAPNLITLTDPRSPAAEAYRALRTNLVFSAVDKALRTLVVTAPMSTPDKSTTAANLAVTLAQGGRQTILVDADLRQPAQHGIWQTANETGLTTMMLDDDALAAPPLAETGVEGLHLLTGGPLPPNPADLLGSARMDKVIAVLEKQADIVVFDAPPVLAVTDAALLGTKLGGALLVVRAGSARRDDAARAKETLARVGVEVLGAVLSNVPRSAIPTGYGK